MHHSARTSDMTQMQHREQHEQAMLAAAAHFNQFMAASTNHHGTTTSSLNYMSNPFVAANKVCFFIYPCFL
jgi:hypothetical protein